MTAGHLTITRDAVIQNGSLLDRAGNISVVATNSINITDGGGILSLAFLQDVGSLQIRRPRFPLTTASSWRVPQARAEPGTSQSMSGI